MLKKFEIACLIGTNQIIYRSIRIKEDTDKAHFKEKKTDAPLELNRRILELLSDK